MSSFGITVDGPASICSTTSRGAIETRLGRLGSSLRVYTVTSTPRRASEPASAATCTFWPPASTPPSVASGLACSDTMATLTPPPPRAGPPSRRESAANRSAPGLRPGRLFPSPAPHPGHSPAGVTRHQEPADDSRRRRLSGERPRRLRSWLAPPPACRAAWPRSARAPATSSERDGGRHVAWRSRREGDLAADL